MQRCRGDVCYSQVLHAPCRGRKIETKYRGTEVLHVPRTLQRYRGTEVLQVWFICRCADALCR